MLYAKDIEVPANTAETAKVEETVHVSGGVIHKIDILFPAGCAKLCKLQMFEGGHQFVASTEGMFVSGDGETIVIPEFYEIKNPPRIITIKAWNEDEVYPHTPQVRIYQLPKEVLLPAGATEGIVAALSRIFVDRFVITVKEKEDE